MSEIGDHSICRHCGGDIVRTCDDPAAHGVCKGWKHAEYATSQPAISHYCGGRSVNQLAEPHLPWRTGRKVGRTIYEQPWAQPSDDDPLIGVMDTRELAAEACAAHNYRLALRANAPAIHPQPGEVAPGER